jgi:hypothetical protein
MAESNGAPDKLTALFCCGISRLIREDEHGEEEEDDLVADFGASSVERYAAP